MQPGTVPTNLATDHKHVVTDRFFVPPRSFKHSNRWEVQFHEQQGVEHQRKIIHNLMITLNLE